MTLEEVRNEINRLTNLKYELEKKKQEAHKDVARKFVGKCFKSNKGDIIKIIGIPRTILRLHGEEYNEYRFPAVFLNYPDIPEETCIMDDEFDKILPCYCDTVYFDVDFGIPDGGLTYKKISWSKISLEEFNSELEKCITRFKELTNV